MMLFRSELSPAGPPPPPLPVDAAVADAGLDDVGQHLVPDMDASSWQYFLTADETEVPVMTELPF